jgi:hypothetical protein
LFTRGSKPNDDYQFTIKPADMPGWATLASWIEQVTRLFDYIAQPARIACEIGNHWLILGIERTARCDHVGRKIFEINGMVIPATLARATGAWWWGLALPEIAWCQWLACAGTVSTQVRFQPPDQQITPLLQEFWVQGSSQSGWVIGLNQAALDTMPTLKGLIAIATLHHRRGGRVTRWLRWITAWRR